MNVLLVAGGAILLKMAALTQLGTVLLHKLRVRRGEACGMRHLEAVAVVAEGLLVAYDAVFRLCERQGRVAAQEVRTMWE